MSSIRAKIDNDKSLMGNIIDNIGGQPMISDTIKALRTSRNWTQAELARRLCVTRNGVNSWEQGLSMPSLSSIVELSKVFSVSTDYLLGVDDLNVVNVSGLDKKDIALVIEIVERLKRDGQENEL